MVKWNKKHTFVENKSLFWSNWDRNINKYLYFIISTALKPCYETLLLNFAWFLMFLIEISFLMKPWKKNYKSDFHVWPTKIFLRYQAFIEIKKPWWPKYIKHDKKYWKLLKSLTGRQNVMQYRTASIFDFDTSFISVDHRHVKNDKRWLVNFFQWVH